MSIPFSEADLFPAGVARFSIAYRPEEGADPARYGIAFPPALARAVPKRRLEFAAGRHCAQQALRQLDPALARLEVGIGAQREPLFPVGIVGTISHGAGIAAAAVARRTEISGVGIDIEGWLDAETMPAIDESVLLPGESGRLQAQTGWPAARVATVVFSAKETLYKCLFPSVQRYFDFKDAEISSIDTSTGRFTARLLVSLTDRLRAQDSFEGRLQLADSLVVTSMVTSVQP